MKREHETKTTPSGDELIFYCDCNDNVIDQVSGLNLAQRWPSFTPTYVTDPIDSSRKCLKKTLNVRCPVIIGNHSLTGTDSDVFIISATQYYPDETNRKFLASPVNGNRRVEFKLFVNTGDDTYDGNIFDSTGLGNNNSNSNNSGISLLRMKNTRQIIIRARNNTSTNIDTVVGSFSSLTGKWLNCIFEFEYLNQSAYKASVYIYNDSTGELIASTVQTLTIPLIQNRYNRTCCNFLVDETGGGRWGANNKDYIKEVKVWKIVS